MTNLLVEILREEKDIKFEGTSHLRDVSALIHKINPLSRETRSPVEQRKSGRKRELGERGGKEEKGW